MVNELNQEVKSEKKSLLGWLIDKIAPKKKQHSISKTEKEGVKKISVQREKVQEEPKEKDVSSLLKDASFAVVTTNDPISYSPIPQNRSNMG